MKTIEFNPDGKSTINPPDLSFQDEAVRKELLIEVLPLIFHKLKNKLTPILGYTQILISRTSDEFIKERLARIERNTAELTESLNTLKEYFQGGCGRRQPIDINGVVEGLAAQWQALAAAAGARVVVELAPGLPELLLDAGQMRILLLGMADNAANALKRKPDAAREIRISTRLQGSSLELAIRDNGCGMNEEDVASIWMPFYSKFPGHAGLGLVLCEKVIANHDAACTVTSVEGEFSQFAVVFPAAVPETGQKKSVKKSHCSQT